MSDSFDQLFGTGSKAIRRGASFRATQNASGMWEFEAVEMEATTLSPEGSIDTARIMGRFHCGHYAQEGLGGQCAEPGCSNVSCKQCFANARCSECFIPLCLEHLHKLRIDSAALLLCARCRDRLKRNQCWKIVLRWIARPFVGSNCKEKHEEL
jgi:hypothetical protein